MTAGVMCAVAVRHHDFTDDFDMGRATLTLTRAGRARSREKTFSVAQRIEFWATLRFRELETAN